MSQVRDPAIKHFGRNIPLTDGHFLSDSLHNSDLDCHTPSIPQLMYECEEATKTEVDGRLAEKYCKRNIPSDLDDRKDNNCQNSTQENEVKADQKPEEDVVSKGDIRGQEKVLKKPTKVLPCPRCNSLETKFCYFNNYNVNQPRHFCKNCRRYWTTGGIMRNVPVRVGRRNNKHLASQCNQVVVPPNVVPVILADTIISAGNCSLSRVGLPSSSGLVQGVGEVLKFSTDAPLRESMATVLNLKDQKRSGEIGSTAAEDDGEEPLSSGSSLVAATSQESELLDKEIEQFALPGHGGSFNPTHTLQCYPFPPWAYPWNPDWNAMVFGLNSSIPNPTHMGSPPMVAVAGFSRPSITFPFIPASYWSCIPSYDPRKWKIPLVGSTGSASVSSSTSNSSCSGNSSLTLGKHSRDTNLQAEETKKQCLWVPKTLRIDDTEEAAKSSIWSTLGIKPDNDKPIIRGGIFKAFQSKSVTISLTSDADQVLQANPAAFSRSQSFQESTLRDTSGV